MQACPDTLTDMLRVEGARGHRQSNSNRHSARPVTKAVHQAGHMLQTPSWMQQLLARTSYTKTRNDRKQHAQAKPAGTHSGPPVATPSQHTLNSTHKSPQSLNGSERHRTPRRYACKHASLPVEGTSPCTVRQPLTATRRQSSQEGTRPATFKATSKFEHRRGVCHPELQPNSKSLNKPGVLCLLTRARHPAKKGPAPCTVLSDPQQLPPVTAC